MVSVWDYAAGLGAGRAGAGGGGDCTDTSKPGCLAGYRSRDRTAVLACPAGRGVWEGGTGGGRFERTTRGARYSEQNWGTYARGGAVSAERNANAPVQSPRSQACPEPSRRVSSLRLPSRS